MFGPSPICPPTGELQFAPPSRQMLTLTVPSSANYVIGIDGEFELVFGTSASSPVVGSLITLINDARIAAGKGPVGKSIQA